MDFNRKMKRLSKNLKEFVTPLNRRESDTGSKILVNNDMLAQTATFSEKANCIYEAELGHGNTAKVYKGIWQSNNESKEVAIKHFAGDLSKVGTRPNSNNLEFLMELTTLRKLQHPHIIEYFSANNEKTFIILEYCANGTLHSLIHSGTFISWPDRITMCYQIVQAIKYTHSRQIIHADLRSANVLVASKNPYHIKVFDFASSRSLHESPHVVEGNWAGEIRWQPPEVCRRKLDKVTLIEHPFQVDIYSLGVLFWEFTACSEIPSGVSPLTSTISGIDHRMPFAELKDDPVLIMKAIIEGQRPHCDNESAPTQFVEVLKKCWHGDPVKRPVILDLENIFELFDIHGIQFPFTPQTELGDHH